MDVRINQGYVITDSCHVGDSLIDVPVVALECCPQHTEVPNDPGILIFFKCLIPLHLRGLMLIFKDMERDTDEICDLGDHHVGTILI